MMTSQFHINPVFLLCVFSKKKNEKESPRTNLLDVEKKKSGKGLCNVHMSEVGNMCEVSCLY